MDNVIHIVPVTLLYSYCWVPCRSFGHGDGRLSEAAAGDWLNIAFGRGQCSLGNTKLCAAHALTSEKSVTRSQLVTSHALQSGQVEKINAAMDQLDGRTSVVVLKRLWDETSMRLNIDAAALELLTGQTLARGVQEVKRRGRGGKGSVYPGYTVQSFQQMAHLRWGRDDAEAQEVFIPARLITSSDCDSIWNGLCDSMPCFGVDRLLAIASRARAFVIHSFPDGHPSNRVVMQHLVQQVPNGVFLQGHCCAHMAQLVWDTGSQKRLANPLYQLVQLMTHAGTSGKVMAAMETTAVESDILVGIPLLDTAFNDCVLEYTIRRPLLIGSFFKDPGAARHDPESYAAMVESLSESCREIQDGLTGNWSLPQCTHNCHGELPGNRCCSSLAAAKERARRSMKALAQHSICSLQPIANNKWRSISQAVTKIGPSVMIHDSMKKAFARTLATPAEVTRLKGVIQAHADLVAAADIEGRQVTDATAFQALRGRRILGVREWQQTENSRFHVLSFLIGSVAIDKMFSTIFECEEYGKTLAGGPDEEGGRGRIGFLQSMVSPTGIAHKVHAMMAALLFSDTSPFWKLLSFAAAHSLTKRRAIRVFRTMQLRLSAAFRVRFLGNFWSEAYMCVLVLDLSPEEQIAWLQRFMSPGQKCPKCEGPFIQRLRARLAAPPQLTPEEMLEVIITVMNSLAEDPLVLSMHDVELLHAHARSIGARSMDRRKRLPVSLFSCQFLQRWTSRHKARMKKNFRPAQSVRQKILKRKRPSKTRQVSAHNIFVKDAQLARHLPLFSCSFPLH